MKFCVNCAFYSERGELCRRPGEMSLVTGLREKVNTLAAFERRVPFGNDALFGACGRRARFFKPKGST